MRLGGPQSRSGRCGEEKILDPTGPRTRAARDQSLYRLRYPGTLVAGNVYVKFVGHQLKIHIVAIFDIID
jgi:hypothetical protein